MDITIQDKAHEAQRIALVVNNVEFIVIAKALSDYCEIVKGHIMQKAGVDNIEEVKKLDLNFDDSCYLTAGMIVEKIVNRMLEAEASVSRIQYEEVKNFVKKNLAS